METSGAARDDSVIFRYCPACAGSRIMCDRGRRWHCPDCGFEYFHNVATASGVIIETPQGIVLLERAKEPGRGLYSLPGGFIDPGEGALEGTLRECREETGWTPRDLRFLCSFPNRYEYRSIVYDTCDLYFAARASMEEVASFTLDPAEASGILVADGTGIPWEKIAFPSATKALRQYIHTEASL